LGAGAVLNHSAIALLQLSGGFEMRRLALVLVIITFLSACGSPTQNPNVNPTPVPTPDLTGRFVEVPNNQPFKYSVVAAGLLQVGGGLTTVGSTGAIGPSYNNLRLLQKLTGGNFIVTYDGYAQPDDNSNVIVKALAEGVNQGDGPYVVSFRSFNAAGISLRVHDLSANGPPNDFKEVKVMLEISRYVRTN